MPRLLVVTVAIAALGACSTATGLPPLDRDGGTLTDGAVGPGPCGDSPPPSGVRCSIEGLSCSYGDDLRASCRTQATCRNGGWQVQSPRCVPPSPDCPGAQPATGAACAMEGMFCAYGDRSCGCTSCGAGPCGGQPRWGCDTAPTANGCPSRLPNLGAACSVEGADCPYGSCGGGNPSGRRCLGGRWRDEPTACPL